jgi:hypothetical protein
MNEIEFVFGHSGDLKSDMIKLLGLINDRIRTIEQELITPKSYILLDSQSRIWKVTVDYKGELIVSNFSNGTLLLATDPEIIEKGDPFLLKITEALDPNGNLIEGEQTVNVVSSNGNEGNGGILDISALTFVKGAANATITLDYSNEQQLTVTVGDLGELCEGTIEVDVVQTGQLNVYSSSSFTIEDAGLKDVFIDRAFDDDGEILHGDYYLQIVSDNTDEGTAGVIFEELITLDNGATLTEISGISLSEVDFVATQDLTFKISVDNTYEAFISEGKLSNILVLPAPNTMLIANDASVVRNVNFDVDITRAVGDNSELLSGELRINITSDKSGVVRDATVTLVDGAIAITNLSIAEVDTHVLNIAIRQGNVVICTGTTTIEVANE